MGVVVKRNTSSVRIEVALESNQELGEKPMVLTV